MITFFAIKHHAARKKQISADQRRSLDMEDFRKFSMSSHLQRRIRGTNADLNRPSVIEQRSCSVTQPIDLSMRASAIVLKPLLNHYEQYSSKLSLVSSQNSQFILNKRRISHNPYSDFAYNKPLKQEKTFDTILCQQTLN